MESSASKNQLEKEEKNTNDRREDFGMCSIYCLGADQILTILQKLPVASILRFGMTCRRFKDLASSDTLWVAICRRDWGNRVVDAWLEMRRNRRIGWKALHRKMLSLGSVTWQRLHQGDYSPSARASHSMVNFSEKIAIFGGGYDGGRHLDDTWVASLPDDLSKGIYWQHLSAGIPDGRFGHSCTLVRDTLILFGGINDHGTRQNDTWINKGLSSLSMEGSNSWEVLEVAAAPSPRGAHAGSYAGEQKVVIFGGIQSDGIRLDDTWSLDLLEKPLPAWRKLSTLHCPPARSGHTLTWVGGKRMILFGGRGSNFEVMNDVWLLDTEEGTPEWVELRPCELYPLRNCPAPRAGHSATLIFGGRILIYGGEDARRSRKGDVWVLDPGAGVPMGFLARYAVRNEPESSRVGRKFWKKLKQSGEHPSKRSFHAACTVQSGCGIVIFGGMVDGELLPAAVGGLGFDAELFLLQLVP